MGADLRKLVAMALLGADLSDSVLVETALDRIGALAFSDALGGKLWRLKWTADKGAIDPAIGLLAKRCDRIVREEKMRRRLCETVLVEWLDENCRSCGGRHFIMASAAAAKHVCTVCDGTGLRRYSDLWRMRQMGFDRHQYPKWERRFATAHQVIGDADAQAWRDVAAQLERWMPSTGAKVLAFRRRAPTMRATEIGPYALRTGTE